MQDENLRVPEEQYPRQRLVYPEVWKQDNKDCEISNRTYISHIYNKVYPSCPTHRASEDTPFSFYLPHSQTFSNNSLHLSEEKRIFAARKLNH